MKILIEKIIPHPNQPRRHVPKRSIVSLSSSIEELGLIQPIVVEDNEDGTYTLIAGQRRILACQHLGMKEIEADVRPKGSTVSEQIATATAENVSREDMSPVDEAHAYGKLKAEGLSARKISKKIGRSIPHVYERLKILNFTEEEQAFMTEGRLPVLDAALDALLSVPEKDRIELSRRFAYAGATAAVIIRACENFLSMKSEVQENIKSKRGPKKKINGVAVPFGTPATRKLQKEDYPEWDALYQVGKVPPWQLFTESVMHTCDVCALRPNASESTCRECPLVAMVSRTLEKVKHGS